MVSIYPTNTSYSYLCLINKDDSYESIGNVTIDGKKIIKCFLNYNDDHMQLMPSDQIDIECLNKAIDLCYNKKIRLLLKEDPPFLNGPTVGINKCTVIIDTDVFWRTKQKIVEIDVP